MLRLPVFLLAKLGAGLLERLIQRLFVDRLEKIVHNALLDRGFCVFKMPVAAGDDKLRRKAELLHLLNELQSVAARHPDIRQHNIRFVVLNAFKRMNTIVAHVGNLKIEHLPVSELQKELCNAIFILHNNYTKRHFLPPCMTPIQILFGVDALAIFVCKARNMFVYIIHD